MLIMNLNSLHSRCIIKIMGLYDSDLTEIDEWLTIRIVFALVQTGFIISLCAL